MLQTVRSRVISVNMQTFDADEAREYLSASGGFEEADEARIEFAMKMSGGALGAVKALVSPENGEYEAYRKAMELVDICGFKV